jgi:hypothetical protein
LEIFFKIMLVSLIIAYIFTIVAYGEKGPEGLPNLFVTGMLAFGLPLALFRRDMLGQEILERRLIKRALAEHME